MNILLTNDDGFSAIGIKALYTVFKGFADVYVCAPMTQKSATGHAMSIFNQIEIIKINEGYAVDGYPSDCVKIAQHGLYKDTKFDLVISGINSGMNMGKDLYYSGTAAGAREGALNGVSAIACSKVLGGSDDNYIKAARRLLSIVKSVEKSDIARPYFFNINFPAEVNNQEVIITTLGERVYDNTITITEHDGVMKAKHAGVCPKYKDVPGSDLNIIAENKISLTPLTTTNGLCDSSKIKDYNTILV